MPTDAERLDAAANWIRSNADKAGTHVPGMGQEIRFRDWLNDRPAEVIVIATQWRAGGYNCHRLDPSEGK